MKRPDYSILDKEDTEAYLSSKNDVISKSFMTDLWMKVIYRAIDDLVIYEIKRYKEGFLTEEEIDLERSAFEFLFDDNYKIILDDYTVNILCQKCNTVNQEYISRVSSNEAVCSFCNRKINHKTTEYVFVENQSVRDITLKELLSIWDINNIENFRESLKEMIEDKIEKKKKTIDKKKGEGNKIMDENFKTPTEEDLTDFDKGIIKVLDSIKIMLMEKNRKYGNSATNPVRAFSKSDAKEQIKVRIDDKISRLVRSPGKKEDEDVCKDLIGYLVILTALEKGYIEY